MRIVTGCLCLFAGLASASDEVSASGVADPREIDAQAIDEVIVTATRREASADTIPAAISVVDAERIREGQLAMDALAAEPGTYLQQTTPGQGAVILRGQRGSAVLHLVDGMRLNNAIFRSAPTQYFALLPGAAIERLEVIRGTPASLYGSDAVGGAVQAVMHRPVYETGEPALSGELFAAFETADSARRVGGSFDTGNQRWHATGSAEYLRVGDRRTGGGVSLEPSGYEARAGRLAFGLTPDDDTDWLLDLHYYEQPKTPRVDELLPGFGQETASSSEFFFAPNRRLFAATRYNRRNGPGALDWNLSLAWQRIDDDRITRDLDAPARRIEENRSDLFGALLTAGAEQEAGGWLVGAELYYDRVASARDEEDIASGALSALTSRFPDGAEVLTGSVFAHWTRTFVRGHVLSAGARYSEVEVRLPETPVSAATDVTSGDLAGDLGLIVALGSRVHWVSNLGFGFRAPNVFDLGTLGNRPGNRFNQPSSGLDSESVLQFDTGLRYSDEAWQVELMAYRLRYRDRIVSVGTGEQTASGRDIVQSANAARSDIYGAEAGAVLNVGDAIRLRAVLNWTRGTQRVDGLAEEPADRIPPLGGRFEFNYEATASLSGEAWIRYAGEQDRLSARDARDSRIDPDGTPGWVSAGARVTWLPAERWRLSLAAENVLDKRYRVHGSGLDAHGFNVVLAIRRVW